jgi:hypothetical protein
VSDGGESGERAWAVCQMGESLVRGSGRCVRWGRVRRICMIDTMIMC